MALFDKFRRLPQNTKPEPAPTTPISRLNSVLRRDNPASTQPLTGALPNIPEFDAYDDELAIPSLSPETQARLNGSPNDIPEDHEGGFTDRMKLFNISDEILELVDPKFAKEQVVLPVELSGNLLTVVCANKQSQRVAEHVLQGEHRHLVFRFVYSTEEIIRSAIDHHYLRRDLRINEEQRVERYKQLSSQIKQVATERKQRKHLVFSTNSKSFSHNDNAIRELIENLLCDAHWSRATDIDIDHFRREAKSVNSTRDREFMVCRIRVDGEYQTIHEEVMELEKYERIPHVLKIYGGLDPNNTWDGQSGVIRPTLTYATRESPVEFRANFIPAGDDRGESISIRVQEKDNFTFSMDKLGLLPFQEEIVKDELMMLTQGMAIFAGPINKGKNTTMVCLIKEFQEKFNTKKIVTVEDPPEFNLPYVTQIGVSNKRDDDEAGPGTKRAFKYYLKHILRHNPDIIVIGEVRDPEPAQMAIETAGIGHLVLTTMHTANSLESIDRLRNFGIENYKIAGSLKVVVAQRLVKRICSECVRVPDDAIPQLKIPRLEEYIAKLGWTRPVRFVKGSGRNARGQECAQCQGKGFFNRLGIFEFLILSREIRALISKGATPDEIRAQALKEGFRSLWSTGLERALQGETRLGEVIYHIGRPDSVLEGLPELASHNYHLSASMDEDMDDEDTNVRNVEIALPASFQANFINNK